MYNKEHQSTVLLPAPGPLEAKFLWKFCFLVFSSIGQKKVSWFQKVLIVKFKLIKFISVDRVQGHIKEQSVKLELEYHWLKC